MKYGLLAFANLKNGEELIPYTVPADALAATVTVSFCNKTGTETRVQLAMGTGANSAAAAVFLEFNAKVVPGTPTERTGVTLGTGQKLFVKGNAGVDVDVAIYGYEKGNQ